MKLLTFKKNQNVIIEKNHDFLKCVIKQKNSTPGIMYHEFITVKPSKEYIICIQGHTSSNMNIYPLLLDSIDKTKILWKFNKQNLLYESNITLNKVQTTVYYVIKIPYNIEKLLFYLVSSYHNINDYFIINNVFFTEFNEELIKISNYELNTNQYYISSFKPLEFDMPLEISSNDDVNIEPNNIFINSNNKVIYFNTLKSYIEIKHKLFHRIIKFKIYNII